MGWIVAIASTEEQKLSVLCIGTKKEDDIVKENPGEESLSCPLSGVAQQTPTAGKGAGLEGTGETKIQLDFHAHGLGPFHLPYMLNCYFRGISHDCYRHFSV